MKAIVVGMVIGAVPAIMLVPHVWGMSWWQILNALFGG
jgi:hypothetical protein